MAQKTIVYYFTLTSPWAYLGHAELLGIAGRHACSIDYRPMHLGQIFATTGGLPLAKRAPARQAYRLVDLQRWRLARGVHVGLAPKFFPFDPGLVDRTLIALLAERQPPDKFILGVFAAIFAQDRNMGDPTEIAAELQSCGFDAGKFLDLAARPEAAEVYQSNIHAALADGVFGSPSYVLGGEVFWGQDRLDLLEQALSSGRPPFKP